MLKNDDFVMLDELLLLRELNDYIDKLLMVNLKSVICKVMFMYIVVELKFELV